MELVSQALGEIVAFWNNFTHNFIEWFVTVGLIAGALLLEISVEPKQNHAVFENFNERYPYSGESIGIPILFIIIIIIPCIILGVWAILSPKKIDLAFAYMSLAQTLAITLLITESLKIFVARPRPNYFSYCQYDTDKKECTGPKRHQKDAKVSFPSGHSSNAFACGTWLSLLIGRLNQNGQELWWVLFRFLPIGIAIFIAATRITDYMHHVSDVVTGAVIGIGVAAVIFQAQADRIVIQKQKKIYDPLAQL